MSYIEENKKLARNTIALFIRSIVVIIVALYVSRLLLKILGVEDFGIYQVVGSIVVLFSFLNTSMASASQRFITFELGTGNLKRTNDVFSASMASQIVVAIVLLFIVEAFGLWFLNNKLNIPTDRMTVANLVFQFSIITFCINIIRVPYDAAVIAHEKMAFFAYASIIDAFLKLGIVIFLNYSSYDKLAVYASLLSVESLVMLIVYRLYCKKKFLICNFHFIRNKILYKKLLSFTGWSLLGSTTNVLTQQGFIFLLNIFYGVAVNAAMGIANQVNGAITSFIGSFQTSYRPQLVKSYAQKDIDHLNHLVASTSKMSFALMIIPTLILIYNMPLVLNIWLGNVPQYAIQFCQIILICSVIDSISGPYNAAIIATAKIKKYNMAISASFVLDIILSFILIKIGVLPYLVLISRISTRGILNMIIGLHYIKKHISFDVSDYLRHCILPMIGLSFVLVPVLNYMYNILTGWKMLMLSSCFIFIMASLLIFYILFNFQERNYVISIVRSKIKF